ncbi:glycosyl transferase, group 1 [Bacillus thermotolerans]|nr:glycosyl transferase, group 1 [Bacillus thermotolerans]
MLFKLLKYFNKDLYEFEVISLTDEGVFGPRIREEGIKVHALEMKKWPPDPDLLLKARKITKEAAVIQTWLYHADLFGYLIKRKNQKLIWGIRQANLDKSSNKKSVLLIAKLNSLFSKTNRVDTIISCSNVAVESHKEFGYSTKKIITIPNGFELDNFSKIEGAKERLGREINTSLAGKNVIAHVGRWDIQKDHENLIKAISYVKLSYKNVLFLLCGKEIDYSNDELNNLISKYNVHENVLLLGRREDVPLIMSASDLLVSSSLGEGFSNVIGEAMACETPCVVTDVGDSAYIVGKTGAVVPPKDAQKLSEEIVGFLDKKEEEKESFGRLARERVTKEFDIKKIVKRFEEQYK